MKRLGYQAYLTAIAIALFENMCPIVGRHVPLTPHNVVDMLAYRAMNEKANLERTSLHQAWADSVFPGLQARKQKSVSDMKFWKEHIESTGHFI
jgi:hypothetical protein